MKINIHADSRTTASVHRNVEVHIEVHIEAHIEV